MVKISMFRGSTSKHLGVCILLMAILVILSGCGKGPIAPGGGDEPKITVNVSPPSGSVEVGQNYNIDVSFHSTGADAQVFIREDGKQKIISCGKGIGIRSYTMTSQFLPGDGIYDFGRGHTVTFTILLSSLSATGLCSFLNYPDNPSEIDWTKVEQKIEVVAWIIPS